MDYAQQIIEEAKISKYNSVMGSAKHIPYWSQVDELPQTDPEYLQELKEAIDILKLDIEKSKIRARFNQMEKEGKFYKD